MGIALSWGMCDLCPSLEPHLILTEGQRVCSDCFDKIAKEKDERNK